MDCIRTVVPEKGLSISSERCQKTQCKTGLLSPKRLKQSSIESSFLFHRVFAFRGEQGRENRSLLELTLTVLKLGGAQIGFMSGSGLGGIAERGREEDFFPSVASLAESMGKCINQKQNRFLLAQRSVGFFDQRFCTCPRFLSPL